MAFSTFGCPELSKMSKSSWNVCIARGSCEFSGQRRSVGTDAGIKSLNLTCLLLPSLSPVVFVDELAGGSHSCSSDDLRVVAVTSDFHITWQSSPDILMIMPTSCFSFLSPVFAMTKSPCLIAFDVDEVVVVSGTGDGLSRRRRRTAAPLLAAAGAFVGVDGIIGESKSAMIAVVQSVSAFMQTWTLPAQFA